MTLALITLFFIAPIAEVYVLITAGGQFGVGPVLIACVVTAVLGGVLLRIQGLNAALQARSDLQSGKAPLGPMVDGVFLVVAAPLLKTPGFLTDIAGFTLLVPPVRRWLAGRAAAWLKQKVANGDATIIIDQHRRP